MLLANLLKILPIKFFRITPQIQKGYASLFVKPFSSRLPQISTTFNCRFKVQPSPPGNTSPTSATTCRMPPQAKIFFQRWVIDTLAVLVAANVVTDIDYDNVPSLLAASLLLGILNAVVKPILLLLSLPLLLLSLGLFTLVINGCLLYLVGAMMKSFQVNSFAAAFWGALVISLISMILNTALGVGATKVRVQKGGVAKRNDSSGDGHGNGNGPVIDV